jgi:hypothetical protein
MVILGSRVALIRRDEGSLVGHCLDRHQRWKYLCTWL